MNIMKKMVIGGTYIYSGKSFSHNTIKKIRDGGIIELGYSTWEDDEQWIEVLEDNFFIGFINSKTSLVDLGNYCYVIQDSLFCYEKPDHSSVITICLNRFDKIFLISRLTNKGQLWLKIYDKHGFCCYIAGNSCLCPNKFKPYSTTLAESTIMYITSVHNGIYKPIRLKKSSGIVVNRLIAYRPKTGLDTSSRYFISEDNLKLIFDKENLDYLFAEEEISHINESNFLDNLTYSDDIWLEICARGLTGYIPAITKTKTIPYIDLLPTERFIPNSGSHEFIDRNKLTIPGALSIVLGISIFLIFPTFSVFAIYLWILGMCLILLKIFCS